GISKYNESNGWQNIPYGDLLGAKALVRISVNPNDENELSIASYNDGLIKIVSDIPTTLYNAQNSTMEGGAPRINSAAYDKSGNLWLTQSREQNGLHVLKSNGTWATFDMQTILTDYASNDFCKIAIDKSGTKWIASYKNGVVAFNENSNIGFKKLSEGADLGNLPSQDVRAIAVDNRNQVWIGTNKGLRVLPSTGSYNNDGQMKANPIIILEDGLAQELLYEQFITDIAVNGSNQKWIGTADSGVFLFSSNGQETIYHFTKYNSPLPSNVINDIDINSVTGEIFFATDRGMVSFQGTATKPADNLNAVYVYPNPVRPEFVGTVKIAGLISKANIKITDIEGNLVYETTSEGGSVEWDTKAFGNSKEPAEILLK
ncbi:MAG: ABC transporter substrate-binding protein, partial [Crocinitomicaceae bacterium]|nr:ABC transporter substrate-binding protein [Crocinitomicaceae bacterium]